VVVLIPSSFSADPFCFKNETNIIDPVLPVIVK